MNNIVMGLLYIEDTAMQKAGAASEKREELPRRIEEMRLEISGRINKETDDKILVTREKIKRETEEVIAGIDMRTREKSTEIERVFVENAKKWEDEIFGAVLNRDHTGRGS